MENSIQELFSKATHIATFVIYHCILLPLAAKCLLKYLGHFSIVPLGHSTISWNGATSKCPDHCNTIDDYSHGGKGTSGQGY